jgi:broad specificity phosphatase PhoE
MFDPQAFCLYREAPGEASCPLGERLSDAQQRMVDALQLMGSRHPGETVAAVTHAVMIRLTLVALGGVDGENWRIPVGRGSVTAFDVGAHGIGLSAPPDGGAADLPRDGIEGSQA